MAPPGPREILQPWFVAVLAFTGVLLGFEAVRTGSPAFALGAVLVPLFLVKARWVYRDAANAAVPPWPWALVTFLVPVVGLGAYLVFRATRPGPMG